MWYHEHIGGGRCPIVDTWWQTETGAIVISPLPGVTATKPGSATTPLPGYSRGAARREGQRDRRRRRAARAHAARGRRCCARSGATTTRYVQTYFTKWPGRPDLYFPGDGAKRDDDGYFWILGRVDDVLNVAGHRIGTMEVESALVEHPAVAEAAVVGKTHELKGQAIAAFVTLRDGQASRRPQLRDELRDFVAEKIGAIARPDDILFIGRPAEDALGQDHAPPAARHRRRPRARRHDDARRSGRRGGAEGAVRSPGESERPRSSSSNARSGDGFRTSGPGTRCGRCLLRHASCFTLRTFLPVRRLPCSALLSRIDLSPQARTRTPSGGCGWRRPAPRSRSSARTSTTR